MDYETNDMDKLVLLAKKLKQQKETKMDYVVSSEDIQSEYDVGEQKLKLSIPLPDTGVRRSFELTDYAHDQVSAKTGIPKSYYQRLKEQYPELLVTNINELIREKDKRLVRTLEGKARALLSDRYRIIDNYDVLFNAMDRFDHLNTEKGMKIDIMRADLTEKKLYIKALSPTLKDEIFPNEATRVGEAVNGGIIISNSEVGAGAYKVMPFMNVIACTNGMISEKVFSRVHLGKTRGVGVIDWSDLTLQLEDEALWSKIKDMIDQTFSVEVFRKWVDQINKVASTEIERPIVAINNVVKEYEISKDKAEMLLHQFSKEGHTQWGLAQAVTRIAQEETNYDKRIEMEKAGAKILEKKLVELVSS